MRLISPNRGIRLPVQSLFRKGQLMRYKISSLFELYERKICLEFCAIYFSKFGGNVSAFQCVNLQKVGHANFPQPHMCIPNSSAFVASNLNLIMKGSNLSVSMTFSQKSEHVHCMLEFDKTTGYSHFFSTGFLCL